VKAAEKGGEHLTVEESQKMLMREFEMRMMPVTPSAGIHCQLGQDSRHYSSWEWDNYPRLYLYDFQMKLKKMKNAAADEIIEEEGASPVEPLQSDKI
jgi:hypothetical protein